MVFSTSLEPQSSQRPSEQYISELLLSDDTLDRALHQISYEVSQLTEFPVVSVQLYDGARQKVFYKGIWGVPETEQHMIEMPLQLEPYAAVIRDGQTRVQTGSIDSSTLIPGQTLQTLVCTPIRTDTAIIGTLSLGHAEIVEVNDTLFNQLERLARLVALLIERKQLEETMREAERFLQTALDALTAHVAILDSTGTIIAVNRAWRKFADANGLAMPAHALGANYLKVCDSSAQGREVARGIRDVLGKRSDEFYIEYPCHSPTERRWFTLHVTRFEWADKVRAVVSHQNVTQLKLVTERLGENERRLQAIMDHVVDGILTTNAKGMIEAINPSGARIFASTSHEMIGRNIYDLLHDREREGYILDTLLATPSTTHHELSGMRADGSSFPMSIAISPVTVGSRSLYTAVIQDLTERKQAEAEMLEKERLRLALEKEKEMRELKGQFMSTVSHELRTPLAAIRLASDMLLKFGARSTEVEKAEYLDTIAAQTEHLSELVNDILQLSKTENLGPEYTPEPVNMEPFCRTIIKEMQLAAGDKHNLVFTLKQRPIQALIDPKLMRHAIVNLLANAIKYSPKGGEVRLELSRKPQQVLIRVSDQGIGIPEADVEHLFEPFHRAANVETFMGTGLGLFIVKQAVEQHNGKIQVESKVGEGTTFTIVLPA